jgi:hypothetical protein
MIHLRKWNYFTGEIGDVSRGVSQIVKFLDLSGHNYLLLTGDKSKKNCLFHFLENKIVYDDVSDFSKIIDNKSNLFRVNLLVIDLWSVSKSTQYKYFDILKKIDLPIIITSKEYTYIDSDDVNDFQIRTEYKEMFKSDIWISDKINNTTTTIESLKKSYIRDKKIEGLLGED